MTTGTYFFTDKHKFLKVYFYGHYDSYPVGAAHFFYNAYKLYFSDNKHYKCLTSCFIKANHELDIVYTHDDETDWQYNIVFGENSATISVLKIVKDLEIRERYGESYFKGDLIEFVKKEIGNDEDYPLDIFDAK